MSWKISVIENEYRDDKYRVGVANPDTLETRRVGVGHMGSAQYGILDKECAKHVARGLRLDIQWSDYEELTDELNEQINTILEDRIEEWGQRQTA